MSDSDRNLSSSSGAGVSASRTPSEIVLTGIAVIVPLVVTVYVLDLALSFVANALGPVIGLLQAAGLVDFLARSELLIFLVEIGLYEDVIGVFSEIVALLSLFAIIVIVGSLTTHPRGERLVEYFDFFVASIPGVGTVYKSFRRMGDIVLDDEIENFQEVKLVELFGDGGYVIGFKVGDSPENIRESLGADDVATMFLPLAPNPVTGGFLTYVPESRLRDVDMTIEEGVRNVITSGIAGHESEDPVDLSLSDVQEFLEGDGNPAPESALSPAGTDADPSTRDDAGTANPEDDARTANPEEDDAGAES